LKENKMTKKIYVKQGLVFWFAWWGEVWNEGDLLGTGFTKEMAVIRLKALTFQKHI
jgi:hypothetical protein